MLKCTIINYTNFTPTNTFLGSDFRNRYIHVSKTVFVIFCYRTLKTTSAYSTTSFYQRWLPSTHCDLIFVNSTMSHRRTNSASRWQGCLHIPQWITDRKDTFKTTSCKYEQQNHFILQTSVISSRVSAEWVLFIYFQQQRHCHESWKNV